MSFARERWKRSLNKVSRKDSAASSMSMNSTLAEEETNEDEVYSYCIFFSCINCKCLILVY